MSRADIGVKRMGREGVSRRSWALSTGLSQVLGVVLGWIAVPDKSMTLSAFNAVGAETNVRRADSRVEGNLVKEITSRKRELTTVKRAQPAWQEPLGG